MAVAECPENYRRSGCCECSIVCNDDFEDRGNYCLKPKAYKTNRFQSKRECEEFSKVKERCVVVDDEVFEKCKGGYEIDDKLWLCVFYCPRDTIEYGDKCFKKENFVVGKPFPWMPQDESDGEDGGAGEAYDDKSANDVGKSY